MNKVLIGALLLLLHGGANGLPFQRVVIDSNLNSLTAIGREMWKKIIQQKNWMYLVQLY